MIEERYGSRLLAKQTDFFDFFVIKLTILPLDLLNVVWFVEMTPNVAKWQWTIILFLQRIADFTLFLPYKSTLSSHSISL